MPKKIAVIGLLFLALTVHADATKDVAVARMRADLTFLASDDCEGRGPGTMGIDKAADYIAAAFRSAGLKGAEKDGSFFQRFDVRGNPRLAPDAAVAITGPNKENIQLKLDVDFQALGLSGSGTASGPIVFAGYGITCESPAYDDFHGLDVVGKIVLIIRKAPRFGDKNHPFADDQTLQHHAALQTKVANAEKHKAAGVIVVNDGSEKNDPLIDFGYATGAEAKIPAVNIRRAFADEMFNSVRHMSLADVEAEIAKDLTPAGGPLTGWSAKLTTTIDRQKIPVKNVVGVLEGAGPLANQTVVIGAHYDHLGYGGRGSGSLGDSTKAIHHGADDNASGTTALIELARRFGAEKNRQGRRLVFIAFSGEEMGLLGSKHYVEHPLFPLDSTVAMINMDMVGRLTMNPKTEKGKLEIGGTGTAKEFDALIDKLNTKFEFELKKNKSGVGPSDHTSFYLKGVPVFFLFTGLHKQYHKPTDTVDLINFAGMNRIADLAGDLTRRLATDSTRPEYVKGVGDTFVMHSTGPTIGFMPGSYADDADGAEVASVKKDGPAEKAGIKDGDRIVAIAGEPIKNMVMYTAVMAKHKRNEPVEMTVIRGGKELKLTVTPQ